MFNKTRKAVAYFEKIAPDYDRWFATPLGYYVDKTEKAAFFSLLQTKNGLILDLGCGTGNYTNILNKTIGLDKSFNMLRIAHQKLPHCFFVCADALVLPFKSGCFDAVISITLFEFLDSPEQALSEIYRILKPGGEVIIGTLNAVSLWFFLKRIKSLLKETAYCYARFYKPNELKGLLKKMGFKHVITRGVIYGPPFLPAFSIPFFSYLDRVWANSSLRHLAAFVLVKGER